jgi:predicted MFS family arabinose efflux permease
MTGREQARPQAGGQGLMPWGLIGATAFATFAITASGVTRSPFLIDMSRDLDSSLAAIANLIGLSSIAWGTTSLLSGMASDLMGRRPYLMGAPLALTLTLVGIARGESYLEVAVWSTLAGGCCGLFTGVSLAEVAGRVVSGQRARAIGWVMAGQSLTLLIGVPLAAWIGAGVGWRGVNLCLAALTVMAAIAMYITTSTPRDGPSSPGISRETSRPSLADALSGPVLRLLCSVIAERVCFALSALYYATFLLQSYGLSLAALAVPMAVFAMGNILGTIVGGQLGDRVRNRLLVFALALLAAGATAVLLYGWRIGVFASVALGFCYMFFIALSRPALMASIANVPAHVRGTVMGLNSSAASVAWLAAAALGGWMLSTVGFAGFGPVTVILASFGALIAVVGGAGRKKVVS